MPKPADLLESANCKLWFWTKTIQEFKYKYYSHEFDILQNIFPEVWSIKENYSSIKQSNCSFTTKCMIDMEANIRKSLLRTSAAEVILAIIIKLENQGPLSAETQMTKQALFISLVGAINHSATFQVRNVATCILQWCKAYPNKCLKHLVPEGVKDVPPANWLKIRKEIVII